MENCIGALVQRRDGDTSIVMIVDIDFCDRNNKNSMVTIDKTEHKRYCNAWKWGLGSVLSLVQSLNNANLIGSYNHPSTCDEESLWSSYLAENIRRNGLYGTKLPRSYSFRSIYPRVRTTITPNNFRFIILNPTQRTSKRAPRFLSEKQRQERASTPMRRLPLSPRESASWVPKHISSESIRYPIVTTSIHVQDIYKVLSNPQKYSIQ